MKEIVDILIGRWAERSSFTDKDTRAICLITIFCLKEYRKYLTGGKKYEKDSS